MTVAHPLLRPDAIADRPFQATLAKRLTEAPHLLVLPTGLGKTVIALRTMLHYLDTDPRRILVLAPTKPLCDQHARFFQDALPSLKIATFTGETAPGERDSEWSQARIIVATPQVVHNDLIRGAQDLSDVAFLIFDEAHRATGEYPYVFIARRYRAAGGRAAAGLTASPGNDSDALRTVLRNLLLERVEVRSESDPDVAPFVHTVETEWVRVRPTAACARLIALVERMLARSVLGLRRIGYLGSIRGLPSRKDLLNLGQRLRAEAADRIGGRSVYDGVSLQARALKLQHALELAETQGSRSLYAFLQRLEAESTLAAGTKAARDLVREPEFAEALALARDDPDPPPKQTKIVAMVRHGLANGQRRVLVFANYRETADALVEALNRCEGARASRFVGHARAAGERGQTKREQQAIVDRFRSGDLNVLVATAVGEEGLDLPETDAVILHEPVPSAIRFVQRRGRTGRRSNGRLSVLLAEGTRDESYHWSALRRERKMLENLAALRRTPPLPVPAALPPVPEPPRPSPLPVVAAGPLEITIDSREGGSVVARLLLERGVRIRTVTLDTGDYAVSDRVLVERKSAQDFGASIRDGRLFDQLPRLARAGCGVVLVEGDPFKAAGLPCAAVAGALAAAANDHRVSVIVVPDVEATADFLVSLVRRERQQGRDGSSRMGKAPVSADAQLRFVLEGLPHVGPVGARQLLERFGSVAAVLAASVEELQETPGVGPQTARRIHEVVHRAYQPRPLAGTLSRDATAVAALQGGNGAAG